MSELPPLSELEILRQRRERFAEYLATISILPTEIVDNVYYVDFTNIEPEDLIA